jgi:hypothetical protein
VVWATHESKTENDYAIFVHCGSKNAFFEHYLPILASVQMLFAKSRHFANKKNAC